MKFHRGAGAELTAVQQCVPAWLVFAMFFVVIPLSTIFIQEKQQGTLPRLRSLRVPMATLLAGKSHPLLSGKPGADRPDAAGRPFCGAVAWRDTLWLDVDWLALWAVATAVSLAAIGFALAIAAVARTTEQATTVGGVANIIFGALGGVMVPKFGDATGDAEGDVAFPHGLGIEWIHRRFLCAARTWAEFSVPSRCFWELRDSAWSLPAGASGSCDRADFGSSAERDKNN